MMHVTDVDKALGLLFLFAVSLLVTGPGGDVAAQGPVEQNCDPPGEGVWYVEGEHVVCVGREITLSRLKIWEESTVELHDVDLYLDTANTPEGQSIIAVGGDVHGYVLPNKFVVKNSRLEALDTTAPEKIALHSHAQLEFVDSTLNGLRRGISFNSINGANIMRSTFSNMESGILDYGNPNVVIRDNFFDQVSSPIFTQKSTPLIEGNTIINCKGNGIKFKFESAHPVIRENTITRCSRGIGQQAQSPQEDIYHNDVFGNCNPEGTGSNAKFWGNGEDNWWGSPTPGPAELHGTYRCVVEPNKSPNFDYSPWLTSPRHPERLPTPSMGALPSNVARNEPVTFDASTSQPSDQFGFPLKSFAWDFGDDSSSTGKKVTHSYLDPGKYTVRLRVVDEKGLSHYTTKSLQVVNQDPEIQVSLSSGYADEPIQADVTVSDPDDHDPTVSRKWFRNGVEEPSVTGDTVPGSMVKSLDTWRIEVRAEDEYGGIAEESENIQIPNRNPVVTDLELMPEEPLATNDLWVNAEGADPDDDEVTLEYEWRRNGNLQSDLTGESVPGSRIRSMDEWEVTARARDEHGATDSKSGSVTIPNRAPRIYEVTVDPMEPRRGGDLRATVSADDLDGDSVTISYQWLRNDQVTDIHGAVVPGDRLHRGDHWRVHVTAIDGHDEATEDSPTVSVQNTAPRIDSVALNDARPGEALEATVEAADEDGDEIDLHYEWSLNGDPRPEFSASVVPGDQTVSGDRWSLTVTASDDVEQSEPVAVQTVIGNRAPVFESIRLLPTVAVTGTPLVAEVEVADEDGDPVEVTYSWTLDGEVTDQEGDSVGEEALHKGDSWRVFVRAYDGKSEVVQGAGPVVVQNSPPEVQKVIVEPEVPIAGEVASLVMHASDADGDSLAVWWSLPGEDPVGGDEVTVVFDEPGDWDVGWGVSDGEVPVEGLLKVPVAERVGNEEEQRSGSSGDSDEDQEGNKSVDGDDHEDPGNVQSNNTGLDADESVLGLMDDQSDLPQGDRSVQSDLSESTTVEAPFPGFVLIVIVLLVTVEVRHRCGILRILSR